jgi:hypothetical protein
MSAKTLGRCDTLRRYVAAMPKQQVDDVRRVSRRLRDLVEPIAAGVYFFDEAHKAYEDIGLKGFALGYFPSRGACMGQVPGEVIAAAFGVFYPPMVKGFVDEAWTITDAPTVLAAREKGAVAGLNRLIGEDPAGLARATELLKRAAEAAPAEGRHLFSGLKSLGYPGTPMGDFWRAADLVREHRGDSHVCAFVAHGLSPIEILLLTELWWKIPLHSYSRTRAWPDDQVEATIKSLRDRQLITGDPAAFTPAGEELRAAVEASTDLGERDIVAALGDDAEELFTILEPLAKAIVAGGGYPSDPSQLTRQ